jgi:hypothetical protein
MNVYVAAAEWIGVSVGVVVDVLSYHTTLSALSLSRAGWAGGGISFLLLWFGFGAVHEKWRARVLPTGMAAPHPSTRHYLSFLQCAHNIISRPCAIIAKANQCREINRCRHHL